MRIDEENEMQHWKFKQNERFFVKKFNEQFTGYIGDDLNAAQVRALVYVVRASNASNNEEDKVSIVFKSGNDETDLLRNTSQIKSKGIYKVSASEKDGQISVLTVTEDRKK